jgi:alkanesulfonate monooxygenase SsuD/methylene tetrahydromethanopterin reductase-like flavin-dependent oxidoreductase (luciferase family)
VSPEEYADALTALRAETAQAGRDPEAVEPAVVAFVRVGGDEAGEAGAAWLSRLYRLPPKAFARHLVAGPPETCAAGLRRFVDAGARHVVVMVAGSPAVEQFASLRAAFVAGFEPAWAGAPA